MSWLGNAVGWAALVACGLSVLGYFRDRRSRAEARVREHETEAAEHARAVQTAYDRGRSSRDEELTRYERDRDYWRDLWIRRANASSQQDHGPQP